MKKFIVIKTTFEAIHCWPECPIDEVQFLQHPHRHEFYVTMKWEVHHNDRDKEFIVMKREVDFWLQANYDKKDIGRKSCEDICDELKTAFKDAVFISVFEDNENGVVALYAD